MTNPFYLIEPKILPPLDLAFRPAVLAKQTFQNDLNKSGDGLPFCLVLERPDDSVSHYPFLVTPPNHPRAAESLYNTERILKFLLWQKGGWKIYAAGQPYLAAYLQEQYSTTGTRAFDYHFFSNQVYERPLTILCCTMDNIPPEKEKEKSLGRHLDGKRIGFDLGASDLKISAVINGEVVFSKEIVWEPRIQVNPHYHYSYIINALKLAASKLPKVDAIGGSSAGVYVNNRVMVASLFRNIPPEQFHQVRDMFLTIQKEFDVPLEVVNDGEVTALAGSMSLGVNGILGIALGSSEAGGYVTKKGNITSWLNELAFAPIDYNPTAPFDEWSGDQGCGASYLSQQCVFRLAEKAGIQLPIQVTDAEKLHYAQELLQNQDERAISIWKTMGVYLGYALAHYAEFYPLEHILILGRCTSGDGGTILLQESKHILKTEFPSLYDIINIHLPDEKSRRVGQSIAAASLPIIVN